MRPSPNLQRSRLVSRYQRLVGLAVEVSNRCNQLVLKMNHVWVFEGSLGYEMIWVVGFTISSNDPWSTAPVLTSSLADLVISSMAWVKTIRLTGSGLFVEISKIVSLFLGRRITEIIYTLVWQNLPILDHNLLTQSCIMVSQNLINRIESCLNVFDINHHHNEVNEKHESVDIN